jgi:CheY-like chemotaxis protein
MTSADTTTGCRFTIVDDDSHMLFFVERALRSAFPQATITAFTDGLEALDHVRNAGTDLLITDHSMTHMNGAELIRQLRQDGLDLPIIMISSSPYAQEAGEKAGATKFIEKGDAVRVLPGMVEELLPGHICLH